MSSDSRIILLRVANKIAYVWDVDDIAVIRSKHRICGVLTGTLPHLSQQNVFLGVPLVLTPEETVLLVEIGAAHLVDDPTAHYQPTIAQLQKWSAEKQDSIKSQLAYTETKTAQEGSQPGRAMSEDASRKRREREERKKVQAALKAAVEASVEDSDPNTMLVDSTSTVTPSKVSRKTQDEETVRSEAIATPPPPESTKPSLPYTITISASSSYLEWYNTTTTSNTYTTIESARQAGIWSYPSTLPERARCGVFRGLWEQSYFMGGGIKFGGEYLVYPGDPLRYHSHFTATVIDSPVATLRPMEIVAHGRLGTATKKAHLLCGWDDEKKEVSYLSIEWAGFG